MKGQYLTLEQLLIFLMGIFLLTSIAVVYNTARDVTKDKSVDDQFREVGELVLSNVIYVYNAGKNNKVNTEVSFNIPQQLSSQAYLINLTGEGVGIVSFEDHTTNVSIPVGNINKTVNFTGDASSPRGRVKINYDVNANIITLRDV